MKKNKILLGILLFGILYLSIVQISAVDVNLTISYGNITQDVHYSRSLRYSFQTAWNITSIPSGITIKNVWYCNYNTVQNEVLTAGLDEDANVTRINNQTWTESLSGTTYHNATHSPQTNSSLRNWTWASDYSSPITLSASGEATICVNVTDIIKTDYSLGNQLSTIRILDPDYVPTTAGGTIIDSTVYVSLALSGINTEPEFYSRENAGSSGYNYLLVTYDDGSPLITLNSPVTTYNVTTKNMTFNISITSNSSPIANVSLLGNWTGIYTFNDAYRSNSSGVYYLGYNYSDITFNQTGITGTGLGLQNGSSFITINAYNSTLWQIFRYNQTSKVETINITGVNLTIGKAFIHTNPVTCSATGYTPKGIDWNGTDYFIFYAISTDETCVSPYATMYKWERLDNTGYASISNNSILTSQAQSANWLVRDFAWINNTPYFNYFTPSTASALGVNTSTIFFYGDFFMENVTIEGQNYNITPFNFSTFTSNNSGGNWFTLKPETINNRKIWNIVEILNNISTGAGGIELNSSSLGYFESPIENLRTNNNSGWLGRYNDTVFYFNKIQNGNYKWGVQVCLTSGVCYNSSTNTINIDNSQLSITNYIPSEGTEYDTGENNTYTNFANFTCSSDGRGTCGNVTGYLRYNASASYADAIITNISYDAVNPFWIDNISLNGGSDTSGIYSKNCGVMNEGDFCSIAFTFTKYPETAYKVEPLFVSELIGVPPGDSNTITGTQAVSATWNTGATNFHIYESNNLSWNQGTLVCSANIASNANCSGGSVKPNTWYRVQMRFNNTGSDNMAITGSTEFIRLLYAYGNNYWMGANPYYNITSCKFEDLDSLADASPTCNVVTMIGTSNTESNGNIRIYAPTGIVHVKNTTGQAGVSFLFKTDANGITNNSMYLYVIDGTTNANSGNINISVNHTEPTSTLNLPSNGYSNSVSPTLMNFSCTISDDARLRGISLYDNISGSWAFRQKNYPELPNFGGIDTLNNINMTGNVALWHFNNNSSYGENNTKIYDYSSGIYNLTLFNNDNDEIVEGIYNNSMDLDGTNDYLSTVSNFNLSGTNKVTVSFWVKPETTISTIQILGEMSTNYANYLDSFIIFIQSNGKIESTLKGNAGYNRIQSNNFLIRDQWTHIVTTYDTTKSFNETDLYINGEKDIDAVRPSVGSTYNRDNSNNFGNRPYYIGWRPGGTYRFNGKLDEFAIWNRTLTDNEIRYLYNSSRNYVANFTSVSTPTGTYKWNCQAEDMTNKTAWGTSNYTFSITGGASNCWDLNIGTKRLYIPNGCLYYMTGSTYI